MPEAVDCKRRTPLLVLPIVWLWRFVTFLVNLIGILLALILGLFFMVIGLALISTVMGAIFGIPLFILGFMLLLRAFY